jgi:hypothetical protein
MTPEDCIAASECVRLMAALAEAKTPHSKELAVIVGMRLLAIWRNGVGDPLTPAQIEPWIEIARQLEDRR